MKFNWPATRFDITNEVIAYLESFGVLFYNVIILDIIREHITLSCRIDFDCVASFSIV